MSADMPDKNSIRDFILYERFVQDEYGGLSEEEMAQVEPLSVGAAEQVHDELMPLFGKHQLLDSSVQKVKIIQCEENQDEKEIENQLLSLISNHNEELIISWLQDTAVKVPTKIFFKHWDCFCYPSTDDVFISPISKKWILYFMHSNHFEFGFRLE
jgi:hypothetical protein